MAVESFPSPSTSTTKAMAMAVTRTVGRRGSHGDATRKSSFIERAAREGPRALLGPFTCKDERFDAAFRDLLEVTEMDVDAGVAKARVKVGKGLSNSYGTLHGGAICTLVDIMGTLALVAKDKDKAGVSVEINVSFLAAAKEGEVITAEGRVLRLGKTLGYTEVSIFGEDGHKMRLLATGRHTKAFPAGAKAQ